MSDILLIIVDARYPTAMFPPSLYDKVRAKGKDLVIVLNKVDLVSPGLVLAWQEYFEVKYPDLKVTFFSSCPSYNLRKGLAGDEPGLKFRRLRGRIRMVTEGAMEIFKACRDIVDKAGAKVDLQSWANLIRDSSEQTSEESETVTGKIPYSLRSYSFFLGSNVDDSCSD